MLLTASRTRELAMNVCAPCCSVCGSCVLRAWVYGDLLATVDLGNSCECMAHKDTLFGGLVFKHKAVYIHYFLDIRNKANDVKRFDEFLKLLHLPITGPSKGLRGSCLFSLQHTVLSGEISVTKLSPNSFPSGWVVLYSCLQGGGGERCFSVSLAALRKVLQARAWSVRTQQEHGRGSPRVANVGLSVQV